MASIIDLTSDSDESPTTSSLNRQSNTLNRRNKNSTNPTQSSMESTLEKAIDRMNEASLRTLLKKVCAQNATAKILVQSEVLVPSNEVKPYHADTDSEDRDESEDESEEDEDNEESGEDGEDSSTEVVANPIPRQRNGRQCFRCPEAIYDDMNEEGDCVGHTGKKKVNHESDVWSAYNPGRGPKTLHVNDPNYAEGFKWTCCGFSGSDAGCQKGKHIDGTEKESEKEPKKDLKRKAAEPEPSVYVSRYEKCQHCKKQFDVTNNTRGDCLWHTDIKVVDYDSSTWDDHDERCHGPYDSFENDPTYAEGFIWQCCEESGDHPGCKKTKHKAMSVQARKKSRY